MRVENIAERRGYADDKHFVFSTILLKATFLKVIKTYDCLNTDLLITRKKCS